MSNPSLLCVPYRYKAGVLYSQVPSSNLGDFVVTRSASNSATRVNAAGLIETVLDNVPRLDYPLGGITAGCPALLVEPLAQNQMIQSQDLSLAFPSQANTTPSANVSISPDGTQNADRLTFVTTGGYRLRNFSIVSGTSYTATLFYKNVDFTTGNIFSFQVSDGVVAAMRVNINPVTNTITQAAGPFTNVSSSIENYGNGWYRVRLSGTASSTGGGWYELVTNATKSIDLWGFQFETGLVATSYIPTAASPVTREAETCTATVGPFNSGSVYIAISDNDPQPGPGIHSSGALAVLGASSLNLHLSRSNNTRNRLWTQAASVIYTTTQDNLRLAFTWSGANINVFQNGTKVVTNSPYAITGVHTIRFGPAEVRNRITALAVYDSVLTDVQLQSLTQ